MMCEIKHPEQMADNMKSSLNQFVVGGETWSTLKPSMIQNDMTSKLVQNSTQNPADIGYLNHGE